MEMIVRTKQRSYPVVIEKGALEKVSLLAGDAGRPFLVSDSGVPDVWVSCLKEQFPDAPVHIIPQGESSKCFEEYRALLEHMLSANVSRKDTVIALGGGVVGDLAGFAAATYMRGINIIQIPTTSLSQIDSGIGGKTAIDLNGIKNSIGAFWQPSLVVVDIHTLSTLPERHLFNGLAEALKAGLILDEELFRLFEQDDYLDHLEEIIIRSLAVKKDVVEKDEREGGMRKLLNFGHTFGHAYESCYGLDTYLHGECVAMGMMTVLEEPEIRERTAAVLKKMHLPLHCEAGPDEVVEKILHDKKTAHDKVTVVQVDEIGKAHTEEWTMEMIRKKAEE